MKQAIIFSALTLLYLQSFSQPRSVRKLSHPLNQPTFSAYSPFISLDGNSIIFLNDYTDDGTLALQYSKRVGADWSEPTTLHKKFSWPLNFIRSYTLSPDGQTLFIASQASGGLGGFDIHAAVLKGDSFSDPINIGLPVNSKQHEAAPTLSSDGQTMYFMRCESMTSQQADRCKLMMAKKQPGGRWGDVQELPANINTGNSQTPRIMADGETLIFSSNKVQPNAGGMDLYETRWDGQRWGNPVPLTFVNTSADDQFVSVTSQGQYLLRDTKGERRTELTEYLIPDELKPKAVMRVDGRLTDAAIPAYVSVYNLSTNKRMYNGRPLADGSFTTFLAGGSLYEVSLEPENGSNTFASRFFDLTQANFRPFERYTTTLKQASANDELVLEAVRFKPYTSELESTSQNELRRLSRLLKSSPELKAEIQVILIGYEADSLKSNPDLTEVTLDSVEYYFDEIDSLGQLYQRDTVVAEYTYHNDRTIAQAQAIIEQLVSLGCDRNALMYFVNARPEAVITERKISVKAVLRKR